MAKQAAAYSLEDRVDALRHQRGDVIQLDEVSAVVDSLVHGRTPQDGQEVIVAELKEMLQFINSAKDELVSMQPKSLSNRDIPDAGVQLDAVVEATEQAASTIMNAADQINEVAENLDDDSGGKLTDISMSLYEASSFQDLTGQRITKVTATLTHLEERLNALADAIGDDFVAPPLEEDIETDDQGVAVNDDDLLHGPQLEGEGNSQAEIDAILASFD